MKRIFSGKFIYLALFLSLLQACASAPQVFYWGSYQQGLYNSYKKPGEENTQQQLEALSESVERSKAAGLPVAPGVFAHIGFLQLQHGNAEAARANFLREKSLYPEATVFMDRLLLNMQKAPHEASEKSDPADGAPAGLQVEPSANPLIESSADPLAEPRAPAVPEVDDAS
ncbi:MAG: DUF4810 domain-containing protein [Cellvibrionaceae bacterium]|nr:DUF4810 domain-containing protein [Cellvibrionaceae bacterium]MCV6624549.1 DUF4810 domain-containing protein [Cellvibrionaceae bacterium]